MIKKGIILAGGTGSRLRPSTLGVNKQLIPLYDKPLIYYPLSSLMLANIKDILIIVNKGQINNFKNILGNGRNLGIKISYKEQIRPSGIPEAFIIGKNFIGKNNVALILGDNFFYGKGLTGLLEDAKKLKDGCCIFLKDVNNPENYGVAQIKKNKIHKVI
jgi:glucose-1-phosphate thymidylyltransferase